MHKCLIFACFVVFFGLALAESFAAEGPSCYEPALFESRPGVFWYMFQEDSLWAKGVFSCQRHATADSLTPPVAMEISFPEVPGPAGFVGFDLDQALPRQKENVAIPPDAVGVSFWVKGDGSKGIARVELRADYRKPGAVYEFPLADRKWHRIFLRWQDFKPAPDVAKVVALCFGITDATARPAWYTIDALRFEKTDAVDAALEKLAADANARYEEMLKAAVAEDSGRRDFFDVPARPATSACSYNKTGLAKARAKARRGEPMKWLAYGDSVTVPVQMWNIPEGLVKSYAYYSVAAAFVEKEFGSKIDVTVNAVGGRQLNESFETLPKLLAELKPDVLILLTGDTIANYRTFMPKVLDAAQASGTEVLVVVPAYDAYPYREPSIDWLREYAVENGIACADARTFLLGIDDHYWGDTISNVQHPNPLGHRLIGEVVAEMFR